MPHRRPASSLLITHALLLGLLSVLGAWPTRSHAADPLSDCRQLRRESPAEALPRCEAAAALLAEQGAAGESFEAWMHASEVASQLGEKERAQGALDRAVVLLPDVDDPLAAHRLARRRGLNAYREGQPVRALRHFLEALAAARGAADPKALSISENDLGVTQRHLGNYPAALGHFESSLHLREAQEETELGALLSNIGALYLELGDLDRAESYLQRALQDHRSSKRSLLEHHTQEELAKLAQRRGDREGARRLLDEAWQHYLEAKAPRDQLRVALLRADLEINSDQRAAAAEWLDAARALAAGLQRQDSLQIELLSARMATDPAAEAAAFEALGEALQADQGAPPERIVRAHSRLADLAESLGRLPETIHHLREFQRLGAELSASRHGERFDGLRVRFDLEQLEAEAARSNAELAQRRLETVLVAGLALLALGALGFYSQARQYRQRMQVAAERQALEQRITDSRRAAESLRSDLRSMAWLLDRQQAAALVFDAAGTIRALTSPAAAMLGETPQSAQGRALADVLDPQTALWAQSLVESDSLGADAAHEDLGTRPIELNGRSLPLHCRRLALEEELGVLFLGNAASPAPYPAAAQDSPTPAAGAGGNEQTDGESERLNFRRLLVNLMRTSLEAWERATRKGRIDLAQASGVWRITIDDGRLRVRAMDRYLNLDTLPDHPRWHEVLRTAYYLLSEVTLEESQRTQLEQMVEQVLQSTRPAD